MLNHSNKIICNDHELAKFFNKHYINVIEKWRKTYQQIHLYTKIIALKMTNKQLIFYIIPIKKPS